MNIIAAPHPFKPLPNEPRRFSLFLAGSIEMGAARHWQDSIIKELKDFDIDILNPRRDDWDSSWVQSKENSQFREQVEWELSGLEWADLIVVYLDPATKSPISLLEIGLDARAEGRLLICCPPGFWRKGNIEIVCERYHIPLTETIGDLVVQIKERLSKNN